MRFILVNFFLLITAYSLNGQSLQEFSHYQEAQIIRNDGSIMESPWSGGLNSPIFSQIDANLDGLKDIFVFDKTSNESKVFLATRNGTAINYSYSPKISKKFPEMVDWCLLRDYNNDGLLDIFTRNNISYNGNIVYKNTSSVGNGLSFEIADARLSTQGLITRYANFKTPIYISQIDLPAITDVDNDGDLDIISFGVAASRVFYFKNMSIERYGVPDSIVDVYEIRNECWGSFYENFANSSIVLNSKCNQRNISNPETIKHSGSTVTEITVNGSSATSLLIGDVSFNKLTLITNGDVSTKKTHSNMIAKDSLFPKNNGASSPINLYTFPAAYNIDVNLDGALDLLISPYCYSNCENTKGVHYYKNKGTSANPSFQLITKNFLQKETIDLGETAHPRFFDFNNDGLLDIVVGSYGRLDTSKTSNYKSSLYLYKNIGSSTTPKFILEDTNYLNISKILLDKDGAGGKGLPALGLCPAFGDVDKDGDKDLFIGDAKGNVHYFENTAASGAPSSFTLRNISFSGFNVGGNATPTLFDLDKDNILDLVVGNTSGTFSYFKNITTTGSNLARFINLSSSLGNANTKTRYYRNGRSVPFLYTENGSTIMLSGSHEGGIFKYTNIDENNLKGDFFKADTATYKILHRQSSIDMADLNGDGFLELIIGTEAGGVILYKGKKKGLVNAIEKNFDFTLFPNPAKKDFTIVFPRYIPSKNMSVSVFNTLGQTLLKQKLKSKTTLIQLPNNITNGIYFVNIKDEVGITFRTKKIVISN